MRVLRRSFLLLALAASSSAVAQQAVPIQKGTEQNGNPSSGGYKPAALSLLQLLDSEPLLTEAMMAFMQAGDSETFRNKIMKAAQAGDIGAELLLAEQYIPEQ